MPTDQAGHEWERVGNVRVTFIPQHERDPGKDWAGADVLRIQAYKDDQTESLFPGAEFPVPDSDAFADLVRALCRVYLRGRGAP